MKEPHILLTDGIGREDPALHPVFMGMLVLENTHPNIPTRSSALKCVYRLSICRVLWPVMAATCMGFNPFSKSLLVASWRRSCKGQALDPGGLTDPLEGLGDRIGTHTPHPAIEAPGQPVQGRQRRRRERHPPRRPGLRLGDQKHPGLAVQVVPAHGGGLPAAHGGLDGPGNEGADFTAICVSGGQEAGLLIVHQTPGSRIRGGRSTNIANGVYERDAPFFAGSLEDMAQDIHLTSYRGWGYLSEPLIPPEGEIGPADRGDRPVGEGTLSESVEAIAFDLSAFFSEHDLALIAVEEVTKGGVFGFGPGDKETARDFGFDGGGPGLSLSLGVEGPGQAPMPLPLNDGPPIAGSLLKTGHEHPCW